jgi:hypothetical protein
VREGLSENLICCERGAGTRSRFLEHSVDLAPWRGRGGGICYKITALGYNTFSQSQVRMTEYGKKLREKKAEKDN